LYDVGQSLHVNCELQQTHPVRREANIMKVAIDPVSAITIRHVERGAVTIGDEVIRENVVLLRDRIVRDWVAKDLHALTIADLGNALAHQPEIILFGTGWENRLPPRELVFALARRGIGLETMDTPAACRTFNILVSEERNVAALLIIK
jgi:uncharacterized protein